jgi:hypothetical protein
MELLAALLHDKETAQRILIHLKEPKNAEAL